MNRGDSLLSSGANIKLIASVIAEEEKTSKVGKIVKQILLFFMNREGEKYKLVLYKLRA